MPDTVINVSGKDDGSLERIFDRLKTKAEELGVATDRLQGFDKKTFVEKREIVGNISERSTNVQMDLIQDKFEKLEKEVREKAQSKRDNLGKRQDGTYDVEGFNKIGKEEKEGLNSIEQKRAEEIKRIEQESLNQLRIMTRLLMERDKIDRENAQRDNKEHSGGLLTKLKEEREALRADMENAPDESSAKAAANKIRELNKRIHGISGAAGEGLTGGQGGDGGGINMMGGAMAMMGGGGIRGILASTLGQAAIGLAPLYGAYKLMQKGLEGWDNYAYLNKTRMGSADDLKWKYASMTEDFTGNKNRHTQFGYSNEDIIRTAVSVTKSSMLSGGAAGYGEDEYKRARGFVSLEKGLGIDNPAQFAQFERQDKYGRGTVENTLEMINLLTSIKESDFGAGIYVRAMEKSEIKNRLQADQISVQTSFDSRAINSIIAATEKLGGSWQDQRQGDMISSLVSGAREGGNENVMTLKYAAARKVAPGKSQRDIAQMIEKSTDPAYHMALLESIAGLTQEGSVNENETMKNIFPGMDADTRNSLINGVRHNKDFKNDYIGKNFQKMLNSGKGITTDILDASASQNLKPGEAETLKLEAAAQTIGKLFVDALKTTPVNVIVIDDKTGKAMLKRNLVTPPASESFVPSYDAGRIM